MNLRNPFVPKSSKEATRNALSSVVLPSCTIPPAVIYAIATASDHLPISIMWALIFIGLALPLAILCFGFFYLLFKDRDRLQSELFQLRKKALELNRQALDILQEKGESSPIDISSLEKISNPQFLTSFERSDD